MAVHVDVMLLRLSLKWSLQHASLVAGVIMQADRAVLGCRYALADLRVPIDGSQPAEQQEGAPVMGIVLRLVTVLLVAILSQAWMDG